ncbi:MAG: hypothetical protein E7552_04590 [Ruminococcaceae bacterium]|nr:hypothetical protein [Oscillospiraceae bacterium]
MKKRSVFRLSPVIWVLLITLAAFTAVSFWVHIYLFTAECVILAAVICYTMWRLLRLRRDVAQYMNRIGATLNHAERGAVENFPLASAVCSAEGEILWYNTVFRDHVLEGNEAYGETVGFITGGMTMGDLRENSTMEVTLASRQYRVFTGKVGSRDAGLRILYYVDITHLKEIETEYTLSRPAVMLVYIDNVEELTQNLRDSERAQLIGNVGTLLEDWVASGTGILKKYSHDWFQIVLEKRQLDAIISKKFAVLDRVRSIKLGDRPMGITLSIGVGQGETLKESEALARQAIEMALGRGGDQAAVKTKNGYDFYGGVSRGVEKRTKVRTRVVATALRELLDGCSDVLIMGHRFSDLDCLGSAVALAVTARGYGKHAFVVTDRAKTLATELIDRYDEAGRGGIFIEPSEARATLTDRTLLIITDTHSKLMVEDPDLLKAARAVAVIDHHRKMVDFIDNALLFYHEPYSSSASEMVAELLQYMGDNHLTQLDAEALLAGIMLDTRSFVMKAGVRTFEAAAYLRKLGADTVEVKRMFTGSMDTYQKKSEIVSRAEIYHNTAIACYDGNAGEIRVAAAQAADELLSIKGIYASFTMFSENGAINISARSFGEFNVQLIMEAIGGGGHITMAGAQLKGVSMAQAKEMLVQAIDRHQEDRERSLAAAQTNNTIQ